MWPATPIDSPSHPSTPPLTVVAQVPTPTATAIIHALDTQRVLPVIFRQAVLVFVEARPQRRRELTKKRSRNSRPGWSASSATWRT